MREKTDFPQNNNVQLCPELLRKISKNETLEELIISGEVDYGFFGVNTDFFQDAIISSFLKNQRIKIVVLDAMSLEAINLLLPVLSNIPHLKIRNLCFNRITYLCDELSKSFPKAPVIELYDEVMDKKSYHQIDSFNRRDKKRELETENEIEDSNKKRRVDNDMVVEDFNITPPNQAVVQNTSASLVLSKDTIDLSEEEVKAFEQIRQVYVDSVHHYFFGPTIGTKNSKNQKLKREFLDLPNKNICSNYKQFIPMLSKKTSPISELKHHVLLSAVEQGNRDVVNFLLGGKVRMVFDEPTPENKKAVLAEYELLIIKKPSEKLTCLQKKTANLFFLGFKNDQGKYEERPIIRKINWFRDSLICKEAAVIKYVIKSAEGFNASQNFLHACNLEPDTIKAMVEVALKEGHLQILYDLIEYDNLPVAEKNNFSSMINYFGEIAVEKKYESLLKHLVTFQREHINIKPLIQDTIECEQFGLLDIFFNCCLLSDEDIESYLRYTDSLNIQQYFFDSSKNHFYSIANKSLGYAVQVLYDQNALPEQTDKVINDAGRSVILLISSDNKFTIGFNSDSKYKEYQLSDETHEQLIQEIICSINDDSNVMNTSGWLTRHLRILLLSLSAKTPMQFDPVKLAAIVCSSHGSEFLGALSTQGNLPTLGKSATLRDNPLVLVNLLLTNEYYDLSINDNQFLKQLAKIFNTCDQIVNKSPEDQRKIHRLGAMITSLLIGRRINPVSDSKISDDYVRGMQLSIKNGYHTVLPILLKYKPEKSPKLYEIFLHHTQMMYNALETCEKSHFETIIPILLTHLTFYNLSHVENSALQRLRAQRASVFREIEDVNSRSDKYRPSYAIERLEGLDHKLQEILSHGAILMGKLNSHDQKNTKILNAVVSSPRVFFCKTADEWVDLFKTRAHCPSFLTSIKGWEKIKPWRELRSAPHGFFKYIPKEIFDLIEDKHLAVISKR